MVYHFFDKESILLVDVILLFRFIMPNGKFTCRDQFMVMSYAQFTRSSSLRVVIEATLTAFSSKPYHLGLPHT